MRIYELHQRVLPKLLIAYIIAIGFLEIFDFPIVGAKIQPPEVIFLLIFGLWLFHPASFFEGSGVRSQELGGGSSSFSILPKVLGDLGGLRGAIVFYFLAFFFSCLANNYLKSWLEFSGLIYLILLFYIFQESLKRNYIEIGKLLFKWFPISGAIAALIGIIGWILTQNGIHTQLANSTTTYYPYFGYIGRAKGFTTNPNMLMSILAICILLKSSEMLFKGKIAWKDWLILGILGLGAFLTFSKTLVVLAMGLIFVWMLASNLGGNLNFLPKLKRTPFAWTGIILLFLFFNFGSHIAVFDKEKIDWDALIQKAYTEDEPFAEIQGKYLIATNYWINKRSSLIAGSRNIPFGVGPGGQNEFVGQLKEEGKYPKFFTNYDPHSTYFGAFGELGIVGFLALMALCFAVFKKLKQLLGVENQEGKAIAIGLAACFCYIAVEAITTDVMNFRHYWVLLAVLAMISDPNLGRSKMVLKK